MKLLEMEEHRYNFHRTWRLFAYHEKPGVVITATPIKPLDRSGLREWRYFRTREQCVEFLKSRRRVFEECIKENPPWWSPGTQYVFCKKAIEILSREIKI